MLPPKHYSSGIRDGLPEAMTMDGRKVLSLNKETSAGSILI
jgi:hypothetical protein